jgi:hypothetical protein
MKLQKFNGGLNTREDGHLIGIDEAQVYTNINNEKGSLQPVNQPLAAGQAHTENARYISYLDAVTELAKKPKDFIEYKNKTYYSVDADFIQVKDSNTEGDLGFWPPEILDGDTTVLRPTTPVSGDITMTSGGPVAAGWGASLYWISNTNYTFAFQRVGDDGSVSDVFQYVFFTGGAANTYRTITYSLPYRHKIYCKLGGVWRELSGDVTVPRNVQTGVYLDLSPDAYWILEVGTANVSVGILRGWFTADGSQTIDNTQRTSTANGYVSFGWARYNEPTIIPASYTTTITTVDINAVVTNGTDLPLGTYEYVATVGSSLLGWESEPSKIKTVILESGQEVNLEITGLDAGIAQLYNVQDLDPRIDRLTIYRLGGNITDFTRVVIISDPVFPVNFVDNFTEEQIIGNAILDTEDNDKPLFDMSNLAIVRGQLCATLGDKLYFSKQGETFAFPSTNYRDFREQLTGIFEIDAGLLVFSRTKTWLLNTSNLAVGKIIQLSEELGCTSHNAIAGYRTGAMWHSEDGIATSFGGKVELITKEKLSYQNLSIINAFTDDETYWGFLNDGTCYALDFRYRPIAIKYFNFATFDDNNANTIIHQVYKQGVDLKVLFGVTPNIDSYTIFGSPDLTTLNWTSPRFIEGAYSERKTYKDIYIRATANINIKVYIEDLEDNLVAEHDFYETETHHIKVEQEALQGYAIYFVVEGTGTVYEIEYKAFGRQNGR